MQHRKAVYILLLCLFALTLVMGMIISYSQNQELKVIFLDVGQGDAILIERGSKQILIDGGPSGQALLGKLGKYIPFWDREIEMIIATHPDSDHIAGLADAMKNYKVGLIMETSAESDSQMFKKYREIILTKNIESLKGEAGIKIKLADNQEMEILNPTSSDLWDKSDTNSSSIVTRLSSGKDSFLFTGDLPGKQELDLISSGLALNSRVLKVAHHGSKYSTSQEFLDKIAPSEAIISVGKNNRYGHPAPETLERLQNKNIKILRTDEIGDIIYKCQISNFKCQINY